MSLLRYLIWTLVVLLVLIGGSLGFLVATPAGLDSLILLAHWLAPGSLSAQRIEGRLIGPLTIEKLHYENGKLTVDLDRAEFNWYPSELLRARLHIGVLKSRGLRLHLPPGTSEPQTTVPAKPFKPNEVPLPLQLQIDEVAVTDTRIWPPGAADPIVLDAFELEAASQGRTLRIEALNVRAPPGKVALHGQLELTGESPLDLTAKGTFENPKLGTLQAHAKVSGALAQTVQLRLDLTGLATASLEGKVARALEAPKWSAQLRLAALELGRLAPEFAASSLAGKLSTQGSMDGFQASGQLNTRMPEVGPVDTAFEATGSAKAIHVKKLVLRSGETPLSLTAQADINLDTQTIAATAQWRALAWPVTGPAQVESPHGKFEATGSLKDYQVKLDTRLQGPSIPDTELSLDVRGSDQALRQLNLQAELLNGTLQANARGTWQPTLSWELDLQGKGLNPAVKWPQLPGQLTLALRSEGEFTSPEAVEATLHLEEVSGQLQGQNVQGSGILAVKDQNLTIKNLRLGVGRARLQAVGSLRQNWDLDWQLKVPELARLVPDAQGTIKSSGHIQGPRFKPLTTVDLMVDRLQFGAVDIQRLQARATVDASGASESRLNIFANALQFAGQTWSTLRLEGSGTPLQHTLEAALDGDLGRFRLALSGNLDRQQTSWHGRLGELAALGSEFGDWRLQKPMALQVSAQQASAERGCLVSAPSRICLQGRWSATAGAEGQLSVSDLNFERLESRLPEGIAVSTSLSGEISGGRRSDGLLHGNARLQLRPGTVTVETGGRKQRIDVSGELRAQADGQDATTALALDFGQLGRLQADLAMRDIPGQQHLNGDIQANVQDLGIVAGFVPQVQNIAGQLTANFEVSGTPAALGIGGALRLREGAAEIPQVDTRIDNIRLTARSDGQGVLKVSGSARSGPGQLRISGRIVPAEGQVRLDIQGERFRVANAPDLRVLVSPSLNIALQPGQVRIEGKVVVPEAHISPVELGGGGAGPRVTTSPDVVIVQREGGQEGETLQDKMAIYATIRIVLGDKVRVEAFDFAGNVKGNLLVRQTPQLAPRGTGTIEVAAGEYTVSGQRLKIERGQVLFSDNPIDNPALDLRVTRTIEQANPTEGSRSWDRDDTFGGAPPQSLGGQYEVTVGAQVTGTVKRPELTLFSNPAMPDSSILSYLVLGRAPDSDTTTVLLGKYLSPNLYVGYGVGLTAEATNTFLLRYRINKRFSFRANSSGEHSGADILYSIEVR